MSPKDWCEAIGLSVKTYPNPAVDFINITVKMNTETNLTFRLYNIFGILVEKPVEIIGSTTENTAQINISKLYRGIYIYTLSNGKEILFIDKIVKK